MQSTQDMLNKDINARFEDWLLSPTESLDFEVKEWLDMSDAECQGVVAKALIALENHGGGFLLFGFKEDDEKRLVPDPKRPPSLEPYLADALNAIVKKRAEPPFHVEVTIQKHPTTGEEYPLARVAGGTKMPVRSDSATAGGSLKQHVYYIRAPGPESRGPLSGAEWDALLRRIVQNQRDDIISVLRAYLPTGPSATAAAVGPDQELKQFVETGLGRWKELVSELPKGHPATFVHGHYFFAARVLGLPKGLSISQVNELNQNARKYTGWPVFITIHREPSQPKVVDDCIEAWLSQVNLQDPGHTDFWRISPEGRFFLLRGYQEDSADYGAQPGALFDATLPIWRVGECLLRVLEMATEMFEDGFEILVQCEWTGLAGRQLHVHNARRYLGDGKATQDAVRTEGRFPSTVRDVLPEAVKTLTAPLYARFDFTEVPDQVYVEELNEMMARRR
ncbi:hypothetical protein BURC_00230 [Burkholderiaceae bacterium]|nr:hypothetical protein BURC_00230 [Burkholderiaceae bacterium]